MAIFIHTGNEPKFVLARAPGDCRDNQKKLTKHIFYGYYEERKRKEIYGTDLYERKTNTATAFVDVTADGAVDAGKFSL